MDVLRLAPSDAAGYTIVEDPASAAAKFPGITTDGTPDIQQDMVVTGKGTLTVVLGGNQTKDFYDSPGENAATKAANKTSLAITSTARSMA